MKKNSKKYEAALKKIDASKVYSLEEAVKLVKETSTTKFDSSVDISFRLNVNPTLADQLIRGTITLPHGNGKTKKVLVVTNTKLDDAKESGADFFGGKEMLEKIQRENWFGFDVIVATPDMMGELGKMGRVLGPKGLMPNPKTGTVTMDVKTAVAEIKRGKIAYRVDRDGNLSMGIGRVSFSDADLLENVAAITEHIAKARPSTVKGTYILTAALSTTMGPAVQITFAGRN
ncbi:MAG: 50S ribosomal protein L1 [Mollicutes bacterium]|nr:50S ribosomal protein L1 [bacterium]MDD6801455.1 50S ribosomal protein L1 [Mollicutes bacterium]MDD7064198.1 50S ribosomal protein L1 [Mollicutes bacterium]MDY2686488.1 50S ribosomal protein L1 [Candidatus Enteromonas sp.]MDY5298870.1 50S ribosomal protein L1 [Candidatus Enteromonas sp.]